MDTRTFFFFLNTNQYHLRVIGSVNPISILFKGHIDFDLEKVGRNRAIHSGDIMEMTEIRRVEFPFRRPDKNLFSLSLSLLNK